jgi:hypothetical protein
LRGALSPENCCGRIVSSGHGFAKDTAHDSCPYRVLEKAGLPPLGNQEGERKWQSHLDI